MSDIYYLLAPNLFNNFTLADGAIVNAQFQAVADSFALLPSADKLREGAIGYVVDTGAANAITVALPTAPTGYQAGLQLRIKVLNAVTSAAPTINVNALGTKTVKKADGSTIAIGDVPAGSVIDVIYDGDVFLLVAGGAIAAQAAAQAAAYAASALGAPGTSATSATSLTIGTGTKSFTLQQVGKAFALGQTITIAQTSAPANQMVGILTAFNATTGDMTVSVSNTGGSGTISGWTISLGSIAGIVTLGSVTGAGLASGGGSVSTSQTITVTAAVGTDLWAGTSTATAVTPKAIRDSKAWVALTSAASIAINHAVGLNRTLSLAHNAVLATPTNPAVGEIFRIKVTVTGSFTLGYSGFYNFKNGSDPVIGTTLGQKYLLECVVVDASEAVCVLFGPYS